MQGLNLQTGKIYITGILLPLLLPLILHAQSDTTVILETIEITSPRKTTFQLNISNTFSTDSIPALLPASNLSDLLSMQGNMFMKTYGIGNLSTPSLEGTGAAHTAVLWNGFNLQNPMNGIVDFSLIPVSLMDEIKIQEDGGSALFGSGAIGGIVHVDNLPKFRQNQQFSGGLLWGKRSNFRTHFRHDYSTKKIHTSLSAQFIRGKNQFTFRNITLPGKEKGVQENNKIHQLAILPSIGVKLSGHHHLSAHLWYQRTGREVPPTLTETNRHAKQFDESLRAALSWNFKKGNIHLEGRSAYMGEFLLFHSDLVDSTRSWINSIISEFETTLDMGHRQVVNFGVHHTYSRARSDAFSISPSTNKFAIFTGYGTNFFDDKIKGRINARQEFSDGRLSPFSTSIKLSGQVNKNIKPYLGVSRNFRFPTFNDLYWPLSGNPDLKPETSWNQELGLVISKKTGTPTFFKLNIKGFFKQVRDWIQWIPEGSLWKPYNLRTVQSRGVNLKLAYSRKFTQVSLSQSLLYSYVKSTTLRENSGQNNSFSQGNQLIYVPPHSLGGESVFGYKNTELIYRQQYIGRRYTTTDNSDFLKGYYYASLSLGHHFTIRKGRLSTYFHVHNLWNTDYQVIAFRPMPLRYLEVGIKCDFNP